MLAAKIESNKQIGSSKTQATQVLGATSSAYICHMRYVICASQSHRTWRLAYLARLQPVARQPCHVASTSNSRGGSSPLRPLWHRSVPIKKRGGWKQEEQESRYRAAKAEVQTASPLRCSSGIYTAYLDTVLGNGAKPLNLKVPLNLAQGRRSMQERR
jgi:hypothetical protein